MLALLDLDQTGLQHFHSGGAVLDLRALGLAGHHDTAGNVGDTDSRFGLVHVLTACAGGTVGIHLQILGTDVHIHVVRHFGNNFQCREAGLTAAGSVKGRHAHKTMHAVLALQIAVGVFALDEHFSALDTGIFTIQEVQNLVLEAHVVGPVLVHTDEHLRPVHGLGAAGTGMEAEDGVVAVVLTGQQSAEGLAIQLLFKGGKAFLHLGEEALVLHLLGHLNGGDHVLVHGVQSAVVGDLVLQLLGALQHLLALGRIVPELGLGGLLFQLFDLGLGLVQIQRQPEIIQLGLHIIEFKTNIVINKHSLSLQDNSIARNGNSCKGRNLQKGKKHAEQKFRV